MFGELLIDIGFSATESDLKWEEARVRCSGVKECNVYGMKEAIDMPKMRRRWKQGIKEHGRGEGTRN